MNAPSARSELLLKTLALCVSILTGMLALPVHAIAQSWAQTVTGTYSWNSAANWNPATVPNSTSANAVFGSSVTGNQTVTVDNATTINQLTFGDGGNLQFSYDIAIGNNGLNFAGPAPSLTMTATTTADQTIDAGITLSGNLTISQNSTSANLIINSRFNTTSSATFTVSGPGNTTMNGIVVGGAGLTITGAARVTLSGADLGTGPLNISSGALNVITDSSAGSLSGAAGTAINLSAGATLTVNQSSVSTYSGVISGQGGLALGMQNGTLTLSNANTYSGGTTINTGTLVVELAATTASGSSLGQGPLTVNSGTLTFDGSPSVPMTILGALTTGGGANVNVPSSIPSNFVLMAGSLAQTNAGTIAFAGNSAAPAIQFTTNPSTIAVNSSTAVATMLPPWAVVQFAANATDGDFATAALTGGIYQLGIVPYSSHALSNSVAGDVVAILPSSPTTTTLLGNATAYAMKVGGRGVPQTLDLGTNTLALGDATNSGLILNNSTIQNGTLQLNGAGYVYASGNSTISAAITGSNGLTVFGPAAGGATLTLTSASNSYGNTNINSNTLVVSSNSNLGPDTQNSNPVSINFYGGKLTIVGTSPFSTAKPVAMNSSADTIDVENTAGATFSGGFSSAGVLNKTGPGPLIITEINSVAGAAIEAGSLQLGDGLSGGVGLALSGNILNNGALIFDVSNSPAQSIIRGIISGSGSLTKSGDGLLTLAGNSTYAGPTNINGGGLRIGNQSAATGAVTVNQGTLFGFGIVGGPVTVNADGALEGGGSAGLNQFRPLSFNANVAINAGGTLYVNFARTGVGTANAGLVSLINPNPASSIFNLNVGSSAFNIAPVTNPSTLVPGETYTITLIDVPAGGAIELNGVPVGANYSFTNSSPGSYNAFDGNFNIMNVSLFTDSTGTQLELTFTVVPEPAHVLLIAMVVLTLAGGIARLRIRVAVAVDGA
jgi:fibronectin-binding autotransporter adhesin